MDQAWQRAGIIAPGGTVFSLACDEQQRPWLATGAGIFHAGEGGWQPLSQGQALAQVNALAWAGPTLLAGTTTGQIIYSADGGQNWQQSGLDLIGRRPVTWLSVSPRFQLDRLVLAGTEGAGILRSRDAGRTWQPANTGLDELSIIGMATAPLEAWQRQAVVFAATARGLYRSINGGQSWSKPEGELGDLAIQAVVVSPNFAGDGLVLAGTETAGLFRSGDRGKSWQPWGQGLGDPDSPPPINCLWLYPDFEHQPICLAGTGDGQLFRSTDGGATWTRAAVAGAPVFYLMGDGRRLYAGLHGQGLLVSDDNGQTWQPDTHLASRAITRLSSGDGATLLALGPLEGVWRSADGGETWAYLEELAAEIPLVAAASPGTGPSCLLVGTTDGLRRSEDDGQTWQAVIRATEVTTLAFSPYFGEDGRVWVGTSAGEFLASADGGHAWAALPAPRQGQPLVALAAAAVETGPRPRPGQAAPLTLAAATFQPDRQQLALWRSGDGGRKWKQWMQVSADWPSVHLGLAGPAVGGSLACIGQRCWRATAAGWQRVLETESSILRLVRPPDTAEALLLTSGQVQRSTDGGQSWAPFDEGLAGHARQDLALLTGGEAGPVAYVLSTGGVIWRRQL